MPQNCSSCGGKIPEGSNLGAACPSCLLAVGLEQGAQLTPTRINVDSLGDYEVLEEIARATACRTEGD